MASRSCVNVANRRFSGFFLPFGKAHNTQAVMLFLCTSRPAQRSYMTSTLALLSRTAMDAGKKENLLRVLSRTSEATIRCASKASGPYSYAGLDQRQSESASIAGWLLEKAFAGYTRARSPNFHPSLWSEGP